MVSGGDEALSWLDGSVQLCTMISSCVIERGTCASSAQREVALSTAARGYAGAFAGYIWNPSVTATGCLMILGMLVALPFALKLPKQAKWLKDTPPGRVRSCVFLCCTCTSSSSPSVLQQLFRRQLFIDACIRNSAALLGVLPEACLGGTMRSSDRLVQSLASASKASGCSPAMEGLHVRSSLQDCGSICAQQRMQRESDASAESAAEGQALSSWHAVQVLNNFTNFYITHQIFFLTFTILFILHPIPGLSHVHGLRPYLPVTYSWVRPCVPPMQAHAPAPVALRQHLLRPCSLGRYRWRRTLGMHECLLPGRLQELAGCAPPALCVMHGGCIGRLTRACLWVLRSCELQTCTEACSLQLTGHCHADVDCLALPAVPRRAALRSVPRRDLGHPGCRRFNPGSWSVDPGADQASRLHIQVRLLLDSN